MLRGERNRIEEIKQQLKAETDDRKRKKLLDEMDELWPEYKGLKDFVDAIKKEDCEEITEK